MTSRVTRVSSPKRWQAPAGDHSFKLNVDVAFLPEQTRGGIGGVIRDTRCQCVAAFAKPIEFTSSAKQCELVAIRASMDILQSLILQHVLVESDSLEATAEARVGNFDLLANGGIIRDIQDTWTCLTAVELQHCSRNYNSVAHRLAAIGFDSDRYKWYQSPHLGICPSGYGGGIYGGYYNHYSSYPPHTSFNFTQPNPYPPSHHHQSAQPNPYSPPQYYNSTTLINGRLMSQQFPSSHPHAQARQPPAYSQSIYQYSHPLGYYQPPPPQQNSVTMVVNGHLLPNQFPGASQTHAQFSPTPYHSPPLNPNLEVPLPMISQSQSHESSSASVHSQLIPTKAMATQAISHSAPSPLACEQPQTIPLENGWVFNWENPESMAQQKGSGKLVSSQQQGVQSRVDNLQKSASTVVPSESISAATEALPSLSPVDNGNICKPHVDSCLNMHHVAGCVFGIDKREYNERMWVNSGNGREYNELELERVVLKQDIQIPNSGKQGREPDELYLFDKMPKSNGLCNASSGKGLIPASDGKPQSRGLFQAVRFKKNGLSKSFVKSILDKGGGLATCCEIMDAIQDHALNLFDKMPKSDGLYDAGRINSSLTSIHDKEDKSEEWNVDYYSDEEIATLISWSYSDNSERVDGTIVTGSDDDVVTHEGGSVKKIFNSSASVALSKAATGTCSLVNDSITLFSRLEYYFESSKKVKQFVLQLCFFGFDQKVCDKGGGNPLFTHEYSIMYKELVGTRRLVLLPNFTYAIGCSETITDSMKSNEKFVRFVLCTLDAVQYVLCTLDAPYTIQKLELKLNYQNVLQVFSSCVSVFVTGEAFTSLELLQNENKIDQVYGKAIEWILSSGMRVRYKSTSFSYGDLSELVATEYFSCSMRPTFTRELILYTIQKLELKLNYQNVLQVFSSCVSVFVTGEAFTSLELLQNENKIDQVYGKAIEWILSSGMRVRYKSTSFSYGDLSELVATEYFSCSMRPTFTRELILYTIQKLELKLNYQNVLQVFSSCVSVFVTGEAFTSLELLQNENKIDQVYGKAIEWILSSGMRVRYKSTSFSYGDLSELVATEYFSCSMRPTFTRELILYTIQKLELKLNYQNVLQVFSSCVSVFVTGEAFTSLELLQNENKIDQVYGKAIEWILSSGMRVRYKSTSFSYGDLSELVATEYFSCSMRPTFTRELILYGYRSSVLMYKLVHKRAEVSVLLGAYTRDFNFNDNSYDTHFCSHDLGDDSHAALHGSDTTICGLLDTSATAFGMAFQPIHIVDYSLGTSFMLLLLSALFMSVRNLNEVIATAFAQLILRFTGTTMIMGQLVSGDVSYESLESVQISTQM
ncbi:uncharacterized protein LOC126795734 [Argentina anserina]|uniref:uncharacterized protein LOC126795734 n=1 Tax=Argentina anserina TaxID=57926 RepID=UPI0021768D25|nr:uncharacterized protein LOC126795734 [Potentilla anserina]